MRNWVLLPIFFIVVFSCTAQKKIIDSDKNSECTVKLDSLDGMMTPVRCGVYEVDWKQFSLEKYEGLSALELGIRDWPFEKEEQLFLL